MRALLVLVLLAAAFTTVRCFTARTVQGEETSPLETAHFLAPPEARGSSDPAVATPEPRPTRTAPVAFEPIAQQHVPVDGPDEIRVAEALVHGTPEQVQVAAAEFPRDRALLVESFSWAVAGERKLANSLSAKISDPASIDRTEKDLLQAALNGANISSSEIAAPVPRAMRMTLVAQRAHDALDARRFVEAAQQYSEVLQAELEAPWEAFPATLAQWSQGLAQAQREHRWNPRSSWPGVEMKVEPGDSLISVRMRYLTGREGSRMCTGLIERANRLKGYLQPGQVLKIPTDAVRVHVDLSARWLLFLFGDEVAEAWPVCIGRPGEDTPTGEFEVRNKLENPPWMKEGQEPIPFGDPRNPLGTRWIGWSRGGVKTSYGFHGTRDPQSIGTAASDGCIRLLNEDVERLFQVLPEGAPITVAP